jgi:phosphoribosylglycinamide formyltransferase-1
MMRIRVFTCGSLQLNVCFDFFTHNMTCPATPPCRFVVLVSGNGSNLRALHHSMIKGSEVNRSGGLTRSVVGVISNRPEAQALVWAQEQGIETQVIDHRLFSSREDFDAELMHAIEAFRPDFILLAGFMRILTPFFVNAYVGRLINIHPSLLPELPGLHTHARALEGKFVQHGCTVHFVTPELDHGPTIAQGVVVIAPQDTVETLAQRVQRIEHVVYPTVARWLADGLVSFTPDQTVHVKNVTQRLFSEASP